MMRLVAASGSTVRLRLAMQGPQKRSLDAEQKERLDAAIRLAQVVPPWRANLSRTARVNGVPYELHVAALFCTLE
jgi:hypothetical protein